MLDLESICIVSFAIKHSDVTTYLGHSSSGVDRRYHIFATYAAVVRQQWGHRLARPIFSTQHRGREMAHRFGTINVGNFSNWFIDT